jgi:competence protein ComEA
MRPWLITPAERRLVLLLLALTLIGAAGKGLRRLNPEVVAWLEDGIEPGSPASPPVGPEVQAAPPGDAPAHPRTPDGGGVDPNRAGAEDLVALPGIGPVLAARIVADRAASGPFASPEDLLRVPGIGPATLSRIRDRLQFSPAAPDS